MFVILTSKPGQYRTELVDGLRPVESWDYLFFGRCKARFVIAELDEAMKVKVRVVDESPPETINLVPTKFLEKFDTAVRARESLRHLVREGDADVSLVPAKPAPKAAASTIQITFVSNNAKVVSAAEGGNLLRISLREQGGIPFKCGGGLCGTCKCLIETGLQHTDAVKAKEKKHLSEDEIARGYRMACQTFVNGDISVSWQPRAARA